MNSQQQKEKGSEEQNIPSIFLNILKEDVERRCSSNRNKGKFQNNYILYLKKNENAVTVYDLELCHPDETEIDDLDSFEDIITDHSYSLITFKEYQIQVKFEDTFDLPKIKLILYPLKIEPIPKMSYLNDRIQSYSPHLFSNDCKYEEILFLLKKFYFKEQAELNYYNNQQINQVFLKEVNQSNKRIINLRNNRRGDKQKRIPIIQMQIDPDSFSINSHSSHIPQHKPIKIQKFDYKNNHRPSKSNTYKFVLNSKKNTNQKVDSNNKLNQNQKNNLPISQPNQQCQIEDEEEEICKNLISQKAFQQNNNISLNDITIIEDDISHDSMDEEQEQNNQLSHQSDKIFNQLKKANEEKRRLKNMIPKNLRNINNPNNNQQQDIPQQGQNQNKEGYTRKKGFRLVDEQKRKKKSLFPNREYFIVSDEEDDSNYYKYFKSKLNNQHCQLYNQSNPIKKENSIFAAKKQEKNEQE